MAYKVEHVAGRGRALFSERSIQAGEIVLSEKAVFLIAEEQYFGQVCSACLRLADGGESMRCACKAAFCCRTCQDNASNSQFWHPQHVCGAIQQLDRSGLSSEDATSLRLLVHLKAAKAAANSSGGSQTSDARNFWSVITSLCHKEAPVHHAAEFHRRLSQATCDEAGMSVKEVDVMLRREACNSYGVMAPSGPQGERQVRGSGIYAFASLINHDCLPNLARFDAFDAPAPSRPGGTEIFFRALHDIPAGEELTASYFPLALPFQERQQRCSELYGFSCTCQRCQVESTWSEEEEEEEGMEGMSDEAEELTDTEVTMEAVPESAHVQGMVGSEAEDAPLQVQGGKSGPIDDSYIQVFMLKYVCPQEDCGGTMAPLLSTDRMQCNMCGFCRTESEFMQELKEYC